MHVPPVSLTGMPGGSGHNAFGLVPIGPRNAKPPSLPCARTNGYTIHLSGLPELVEWQSRMRIFGAVGLGLTIVVLKVLVPRVFAGLEDTLVQFFGLAQNMLDQNEWR